MSDTFDHEGDAWESYERACDEGFRWYGRPRRHRFQTDHLFYHEEFEFLKLEAETEKSYLLDGIWIPKKICRQFNLDDGTVYIHSKTLKEILATNQLRRQAA